MSDSQRGAERGPDEIQRDVLYALTEPEEGRSLWTVDELAQALEEPLILDHVQELARSGLVHQTADGYIFATRSALRQIRMIGRVV